MKSHAIDQVKARGKKYFSFFFEKIVKMSESKCPLPMILGTAAASLLLVLGSWYVSNRKTSSVRRFDVDARFSNAITYNNTVYISGQIGDGETIEEQTKSALAAVDEALAQAGTDKSRVLEVTIWLSDMSADYAAMNAVYDKWLIVGRPPTRACVEAKLFSPKCKVEIRVVAACGTAIVN